MSNKASIVFVHGTWADGSSFSKLIPTLQGEGHEVIAAQYGLDTLAGDVAAVKSALGRVSSPAILLSDTRMAAHSSQPLGPIPAWLGSSTSPHSARNASNGSIIFEETKVSDGGPCAQGWSWWLL